MIMVLSSLFPNSIEQEAGLFVRERMFRVAKKCSLFVVSPKPWSPFDLFLRLIVASYRLSPSKPEELKGIPLHFPRFFALPFIGRRFDSYFMAKSVKKYLEKNNLTERFSHIDAHFSFPDGHAGGLLKKWLNKTLTITMRGTEVPQSHHQSKLSKMLEAWDCADQVISVSTSLKEHAITLGANRYSITVVGNGVDSDKFHFVADNDIRQSLSIAENAKVIVTVGGLVWRKGFHRVIKSLPKVLAHHSDTHYLIIGGATSEGNIEKELRLLSNKLKLNNKVHFLGKKAPEELKFFLSASDLFILMSENEGWANVILEALACETPVLASDVGGNAEVVSNSELGKIISLNDEKALDTAIIEMLEKRWNSHELREYALNNSWNHRVERLIALFSVITGKSLV